MRLVANRRTVVSVNAELRSALGVVREAVRLAWQMQASRTSMYLTKSDPSPVTVADFAEDGRRAASHRPLQKIPPLE